MAGSFVDRLPPNLNRAQIIFHFVVTSENALAESKFRANLHDNKYSIVQKEKRAILLLVPLPPPGASMSYAPVLREFL